MGPSRGSLAAGVTTTTEGLPNTEGDGTPTTEGLPNTEGEGTPTTEGLPNTSEVGNNPRVGVGVPAAMGVTAAAAALTKAIRPCCKRTWGQKRTTSNRCRYYFCFR